MTQPGNPNNNAHRGDDWIAKDFVEIKRRLRHLSSSVAPPDGYPFSAEGALSVETGQHALYNDTRVDRTILNVRASVGTAPVGSDLIVQVNMDGTPIFTVGVAIADGETTALAAPDVTTLWLDGSYLTVDITQVGSTTPGSDLTVTVIAS